MHCRRSSGNNCPSGLLNATRSRLTFSSKPTSRQAVSMIASLALLPMIKRKNTAALALGAMHRAHADCWKDYRALPAEIREKAYVDRRPESLDRFDWRAPGPR